MWTYGTVNGKSTQDKDILKVESGYRKNLQIPEPRSDKHGIRVDPRNIATGIQREEPSLMFKVDEIFKTKSVLIFNHT
jgi:hypothetical protein